MKLEGYRERARSWEATRDKQRRALEGLEREQHDSFRRYRTISTVHDFVLFAETIIKTVGEAGNEI